MGSEVEGLGSGLRVWSLGFRFHHLGFIVSGSGFEVRGSGFGESLRITGRGGEGGRGSEGGSTHTHTHRILLAVIRSLGAVYLITTFIRDMGNLLQIRQFAQLEV